MTEEYELKKVKLEKEEKEEKEEEKIKELVPISKLDKDTLRLLYKITHHTFFGDYIYYIQITSHSLDTGYGLYEHTPIIISRNIEKPTAIKKKIIEWLRNVKNHRIVNYITDSSYTMRKPFNHPCIKRNDDFGYGREYEFNIGTAYSTGEEFLKKFDGIRESELDIMIDKYDYEDLICNDIRIEGEDDEQEKRFEKKREELKNLRFE